MKVDEFLAIPNHIHFKAKKLFGAVGQIKDGAIAYIDLNGGGPIVLHTHKHNHLFIVTQGEAKIQLAEDEIILKANESYLVDGSVPHSVWNNSNEQCVMIGISIE